MIHSPTLQNLPNSTHPPLRPFFRKCRNSMTTSTTRIFARFVTARGDRMKQAQADADALIAQLADHGKQPLGNRSGQKAISIRNHEEASSKPGLSNKRLDCGSLRSHNLTLFVRRVGRKTIAGGSRLWLFPSIPRRLVAYAPNPPLRVFTRQENTNLI